MKKHHIPFVLSLVILTACSSTPKADNSDGKNSPETVEITYHVQMGRDMELQTVLNRAWVIYNQERMVLPKSRAVVTSKEYGNRPRIVETFTWVSHSTPDHAPKSVRDIWNQMQDLCEARGGHEGIEISEVPTIVPKK